MQRNCPNCNSIVDSEIGVCEKCGIQLNEPTQTITPRAIDLSLTEPEVVPPPLPPVPIIPYNMEASSGTVLPPPIPNPANSNNVSINSTSTSTGTNIDTSQVRIITPNETHDTQQVIKILPRWKFEGDDVETVSDLGKKTLKVTMYCFLAFIGLFVWFLLDTGNLGAAVGIALIAGGIWYFAKHVLIDALEDYVPEKSFKLFRLTEQQLKPIFIGIAILGVIFGILAGFSSSKMSFFKILQMFMLSGGMIGGGYYAYKALSVHGNVDYETNEFLSDALSVDVDEIIRVSTQTFDETEQNVANGAKLILMTNRKIYFATFQQDKWIKCIQYLKDIDTIGLKHNFNINDINGSIQMRLSFKDSTVIHIDLDISNKETTTPSLFAKKFLETLDDHLLGRAPEKKSRRRRMTTTGQEQLPSGQPTATQSIIKGIAEAEQVSARKLDL